MKLVVASGKGGVGKSMLASSLALLFHENGNKVVACDCDADAPNMGIWLGVKSFDSAERISTSERARILEEKCVKCKKCFETCVFSAIEWDNGPVINRFLCEGCGACQLVCPEKAIALDKVKNGEIRVAEINGIKVASGQLFPGETGSGKVVEEIKRKAESFEHDVMVLDSAAGIGCPVVASLRGCDHALLVTEPTPSGLADLRRALSLTKHFNIPFSIIINKWDINPKNTGLICEEFGESVIGKIPFDSEVVRSLVKLEPVIFSKSKVVGEIRQIFQKVSLLVGH